MDEGKSWGSLARSVGFDDSFILTWRPASSSEPPPRTPVTASIETRGQILTEFPNSFRSDLLRDFCWTYRCEHERHIYEKCQYMDYKKRVKAAEDAK